MPVIKCFNRQCRDWDSREPDNCGKKHLKGPIMECESAIVARDPQKVGVNWYIKGLGGTQCACDRTKKRGFSFCYSCYSALPHHLKQALYKKVGSGYGEAYEEAHKYLHQNVW